MGVPRFGTGANRPIRIQAPHIEVRGSIFVIQEWPSHLICNTDKGAAGPPTRLSIPFISLRLDPDLELQLEHWCSLQPTTPSRSQAIRRLMRMGLAAAEKEREDASKEL